MNPSEIKTLLIQALENLKARKADVESIFDSVDDAIQHLPFYDDDYFVIEWNKIRETVERGDKESKNEFSNYLKSLLYSSDISKYLRD